MPNMSSPTSRLAYLNKENHSNNTSGIYINRDKILDLIKRNKEESSELEAKAKEM